MAHHYDRTGDRIEDEQPQAEQVRVAGIAACRAALAARKRHCPVCGGELKPGVLVHPACRRA
jgi:hypothetical protein